jgi:hypothetical protein
MRGDPVAEARAGTAVRSATIVVTYAGCPTADPHAASNISTADGGEVAAVSRLKSSGESSWDARRRSMPVHPAPAVSATPGSSV